MSEKILEIKGKIIAGYEKFEGIIEAEYPSIKIKLLSDKTTINILGSIHRRVESLMFQDFYEYLFLSYTLLVFN